jgi:hypothetical protein
MKFNVLCDEFLIEKTLDEQLYPLLTEVQKPIYEKFKNWFKKKYKTFKKSLTAEKIYHVFGEVVLGVILAFYVWIIYNSNFDNQSFRGGAAGQAAKKTADKMFAALDLTPGRYSKKELRIAYLKQAKKFHLDTQSNISSEEDMKRVNVAYDYLKQFAE